ncbi:DNA primase [Planctomicrobium sp. SH661]|uniref:DNA primase n=1 Tax=Planctomicrobium sp. SH661 TaxID=3448124 RepID=UPI003F5C4293
MSSSTPQEFRETVRSQTDLVSLIGESISLQPRHGGRQYVGLCPFHDDKNPSLSVYPDRQTFRCWSCNTGGDCFTYLMEREKITFPEALELLARRANVPIPQKAARSTSGEEASRAKLLEVLQWAENVFHKALLELPAAEPARRYLAERNFTPETIKKYRLGFHPNDWTWLLEQSRTKYSPQLLLEARLVGAKEGRHYDNFVNRVLFPICNERGQPVSFGGRVLPGSKDEAKYWNGPESSVFHKSRLLYAIDKARDAVRLSDQAIVVEGYTDCITCHQHGVLNVVATLGTALTDSHVTALKRFARHVVLVFDGDRAGQDAARKAVERFLAQDVDLRILTLPQKMDPAEYLAAYNADEFRQLVQGAPEAWEFQFRAARAEHGGETIDGRQRILEEMLQLLAQVPHLEGSLRESLLIANLSQRLMLSEEVIRERLKAIRTGGSRPVRVNQNAVKAPETSREVQRILGQRMNRDERLEYDLLELILAAPEHMGFVMGPVSENPLRNPILGQILECCLWEMEENGELTLPGLLARVESPELKSLIVWIDERAMAKGIAEKVRDSDYDDDGCPALLKTSLANLKWREEEKRQQRVSMQLSQQPEGAGQLDEATEASLRQAAEFHLRRATRKSTV